MADQKKANRYVQIIERVFLSHYTPGTTRFSFSREELLKAAADAGMETPKNIGDLVYSFRYRYSFPESIKEKAPHGLEWIIRPSGKSLYSFVAVSQPRIQPNQALSETKIPDATPGVINMYALNDEQALLAKLRYNRLIDIFTGVACYSLQNHLRTFVEAVGQTETDEIYIGIDKRGAHFAFPIQAKGAKDTINVVQVEQDLAMCSEKFPHLTCRPIASQFTRNGLIALFELQQEDDALRVISEKHYRLVDPSQLTTKELERYLLPSDK
jgi:hypothetical protein